MIRIEPVTWKLMVQHARDTYPNECCGAMLGKTDGGMKVVRVGVPMKNAHEGSQAAMYVLRNEDLLAADAEARKRGLDLIGIYHSHPDCDAYFFRDRSEEFLPLVFICCNLDQAGRIRSRQ